MFIYVPAFTKFFCAHMLYIIGQVKGPICRFSDLQCTVYSHHGVDHHSKHMHDPSSLMVFLSKHFPRVPV